MLSKRVIPCLDVRNGRLTKGVKFVGNEDIGDPVESARRYYEEGADEIVFYDITASAEARGIFLDVVERVAEQIFIPFAVGGGISSVADMRAVLLAGAEKVSINSAAVKDPRLISQGADAFGSQAITVGMDVLAVPVSAEIPSGYEIVIHGGRKRMGLDAIAWARRCQELGAGELCVNSIDADGTKDGYELKLTRAIVDAVSLPVIASGGAGEPRHMLEAVTTGGASAALIASITALSPESHPLMGTDTINIGTIAGGEKVNIVPNACTITVDFRYVAPQTSGEIEAKLQAAIRQTASNFPNIKVKEFDVFERREPVEVRADNRYISSLKEVTEKVLGRGVQYSGVLSAGDAYWTVSNDIPAVFFGPGDLGVAHTNQEFIPLEELYASAEIFRDYIIKLLR